MAAALVLARRGLGNVWPNPAVGCVIVRDGRIVGRGWTQPGGRPHAETEALRRAGDLAKGADVYVTLEPCAHEGETPPCADALIAAGVARVFAAIPDPDPRTAGQGIERLKAAGIEVRAGLGEGQARAVNAGFLMVQGHGRPLVTLKTASTLDGRIATKAGESKWITGPEARRRGHLLRAQHDAILVGIGTVLADDPSLDCRIAGLEGRAPVRIVLDSSGRIPPDSKLVKTAARQRTWIIASEAAEGALEAPGLEILRVADTANLAEILALLAGRGITRLLVEGGGQVHAAFLRAGLVDRIAWFRAGSVIGDDGRGAIGPLALDALEAAPRFEREGLVACGNDTLETLIRTA